MLLLRSVFALVKVRRSPTLLSHSGLSHPGDFCLAVVCAGITCVGHLRFVTAAFFNWSTISTINGITLIYSQNPISSHSPIHCADRVQEVWGLPRLLL